MFIFVQIGIVVITVIIISSFIIIDRKKLEKEYIVSEKYVIEKGTPVACKSYRHIRISKMNNYKAINHYVTADGRNFETVATTFFDKELAILDKNVVVLKLSDNKDYSLLISYDMKKMSKKNLSIVESIAVGDTVKMNDIVANLREQVLPYTIDTTILVK
ncbi:hypothetical protein CKN86_02825 [Carnobacterium divergens]|uniref:hypothetical protein n=2 Tax=Carnobacterium divergens TaxID=2748 RepID=UPI000D42FBCD|nr:hypothetical protein [Carnobacterium divergens]MCO6018991.1 hypothetical protein [Carnobacterium divergens]TFI63700.1 hypothetical protein CKN62_02860 [Carnobacterium divergens]TFI90863.1 hypothetical protein CKN84_02860 [Carnobacterium divergens]TFJ05730.1 hypothetical protein CKN86_02825 [Carnobacterium divergens]TFJ07378.1 hypothetical protein CKN65_02865 [Carnobacterium divergens]